MTSSENFRKIWFGCADRHQMFRLFNRHAGRPHRFETEASALYAGEWFELGESEYNYMLDVLPPLWIRGGMFAFAQFIIGSVTSFFFAIPIAGRIRHFHGYCDLGRPIAPERMRQSIITRESQPVRVMSRTERLEHIWSDTKDAYRGYAGEDRPDAERGERWVMVYSSSPLGRAKLLSTLTEAEIIAKLPVQYRHWPETLAA